MTPRIRTAALVLCLVASIAVLPGGLNAFTLPKLAVAALGAALALLGPRHWPFARPVVACLALAALAVALAIAVSPDPWLAVVGPQPRYPGLVSLLPYLGLGLAGAALLGSAPTSKVFTPTLTACTAAVAIVALLEHLGLRPLASDVARPGSLLGNASDQGQWGLLALGPLLMLAATQRKPIAVAGACAAGLVVALSGSRAALMGEVVMAVVLLAMRLRRPGWRIAVAAPVLLAIAALAVPSVAARVTGSSPLAQRTATGRLQLWQDSLSLAADHPLGVAPGGFLDAVPAEHGREWALQVGPAVPASSPESWVLELLAVGGPLLLLAGLLLAGLTAQAGWRQREDPLRAGLTAGLAGYAVALLFAAVSPGPACLAALWGGALLARRPSPPESDARRKSAPLTSPAGKPWLPLFLAFIGVVLLVAAVAEIPLRAGVLAVLRGQPATADSDFRWAQRLRPWDPSIAVQAGHAFAAVADKDQAAGPLCLRWLAEAPETLDALVDRATCEESSGDLSAAARDLHVVGARDPSNALVLLRRGVVAAEQNQLPEAERLFLQAADLAPTSPDPWLNLEHAYRVAGDSQKQQEAAAEAARRR